MLQKVDVPSLRLDSGTLQPYRLQIRRRRTLGSSCKKRDEVNALSDSEEGRERKERETYSDHSANPIALPCPSTYFSNPPSPFPIASVKADGSSSPAPTFPLTNFSFNSSSASSSFGLRFLSASGEGRSEGLEGRPEMERSTEEEEGSQEGWERN